MNNPQQLKERIYALNPELVRTDVGGRKIYADIHLENILKAVGKDETDMPMGCGCNSCHIPKWKLIHSDITGSREGYNLSKTFDQNIAENEELVTFLLNIIK